MAAGVQAPTIYRLFADKSSLLDAVAAYGFADYFRGKALSRLNPDPVEDLRTGWDLHVDFGLANPAIYKLIYADPHGGQRTPAAAESYKILRLHIRRIALTGRLRLSEDVTAELVHASGCGTVLALLSVPDERRDSKVREIARDSLMTAITLEAEATTGNPLMPSVNTLLAALPEVTSFSDAERALLIEWLNRLTEDAKQRGPFA